jgi:hypothetical protein
MTSWSQWSACDNANFVGLSPQVMEVIDDTLIVGGWFENVNNIGFNGIAKWSGESWSDFPSLEGVDGIILFGDSLMFSGGFNEQLDCEDCSAIGAFYNGEWRGLDGGADSPAASVSSMSVINGQLIVVGNYSELGGIEPLQRVALWDGENWNDIGGVSGFIGAARKTVNYNGEVYIGGDFTLANGTIPSPNLAHWNGVEWIEVESGPSGTVLEIYPFPDHGYMYVGGLFSTVNGEPSPGIAKFDGVNTTPLSSIGFNDAAKAICIYRDQIYAAGRFTELSDGSEMNHIARFDGVHWQPLENGIGGNVFDMEVFQDRLYIVGALEWVGDENFELDGIVNWHLHPDSVTWGVPDNIDDIILNKEDFHVFPNPASSNCHIVNNTLNEGLVIVTNAKGQELFRTRITAKQDISLDISSFSSGIYYVSLVETGMLLATRRLVKE